VNECRCDRNQIFGIKIKNKPLTFDDSRIEQIFRDERPLLAIFDPVQAFLSSDMDMKQANQVRQTMVRLSVLASEYGVCVVLVAHLNKKSMVTNGILRMLGSVDFAAVARLILTLKQRFSQEQRQTSGSYSQSGSVAKAYSCGWENTSFRYSHRIRKGGNLKFDPL
jgi:predicted ATP-dependent serine protease